MSNSTVTLKPGQYVVDYNYPLIIAMDVVSLMATLYNLFRPSAGKNKPLMYAYRGYNVAVLILILLGFVINEAQSNADIKANRKNWIYSILIIYLIAKCAMLMMIIYRTYIILTIERVRRMVMAANFVLTILILICVMMMIYYHWTMPPTTELNQLKIQYNLAQIIMTSFLVGGNTVIILSYIVKQLVEKKVFWQSIMQSRTFIFGCLLGIEEITQIVTMAIIYNGFTITRSYVHSTFITFSLFSTFYYSTTFVDIADGIKKGNMATKAGKSGQINSMISVPASKSTDALKVKNKSED